MEAENTIMFGAKEGRGLVNGYLIIVERAQDWAGQCLTISNNNILCIEFKVRPKGFCFHQKDMVNI